MADVSAVHREYRASLEQTALLATSDVVDLWSLAPDEARARVDVLIEHAPAISDTYGEVSAVLGADLYDELRSEARPRSAYQAVPAPTATEGQVTALARWAVYPLFSEEPDPALALALFAGGMERLIRQPFRHSILANTGADRAARGVSRVTRSGACDFCSMLARKVWHVSKDGTSHANHWHRSCRCSPTPSFG